ncbi:MAG: DUF2070 family protein [Fervidicoccaceae archaeon]
MARRFEQSFKALLGRSSRKLTYAALSIAVAFSVLKGTLVYFGELLFASFMLFISRNSALNLRRILTISSVIVATAAMIELVLFRPPFSLFLLVPSITSVILLSLSPNSLIYVLPFIISSIIYSRISEKAMLGSFILLLGAVFLKHISKKLAYGTDPFYLFSSMIETLFGESNSFERVLKSLSEDKEVEVYLFKIDGISPILLVVSNVHPGPFRNVSGAKLVRLLRNRLNERGYRLVFLHGIGSHENDPATSEDVESLIKSIELALDQGSWMSCRGEGIKPFSLEMEDIRATGFSLGSCPPLLLISRKNSSMDDLPGFLAQKAKDAGVILVDSQNKFEGEVDWSSKHINDLLYLISQIPKEKCKPRIGYSSVSTEELDPSGNEIGPLGMSVITIECEGQKAAFVVIDGNNMRDEMRRALVDAARSAGFTIVEVATTDNHESTGSSKGRGYKVVGETIPAYKVVDALLRSLKRAESEESEREVAFHVLRLNMSVVGERGMGLFERIVDRLKIFEALIFGYLAIALIVSLYM